MNSEFRYGRLESLRAAIARSPILVKHRAPRLPVGFDHTDITVLEWIAAEARRVNRNLRLM